MEYPGERPQGGWAWKFSPPRDSPKVNVWCGLMQDRIIGPFYFAETNVNGDVYLDMLEQYIAPQLQDLQLKVIFQQDGAPPHWSKRLLEHPVYKNKN
uniref:Tc1-like transposase DDE domain-containing protein n=1 Tax=Strigamia maritima TaxID=126957 RepID=T1JC22_STRMM